PHLTRSARGFVRHTEGGSRKCQHHLWRRAGRSDERHDQDYGDRRRLQGRQQKTSAAAPVILTQDLEGRPRSFRGAGTTAAAARKRCPPGAGKRARSCPRSSRRRLGCPNISTPSRAKGLNEFSRWCSAKGADVCALCAFVSNKRVASSY